MKDSRRENAWFSLKWGICEEKTRDFRLKGVLEDETRDCRLNGGFAKRKRDFQVKWGILKEKMRDFRLNGGFAKRKRVIFAYIGDLQIEKAWLLV